MPEIAFFFKAKKRTVARSFSLKQKKERLPALFL